MGKVEDGIVPYRRAVEILPDAPLIRVAPRRGLLDRKIPNTPMNHPTLQTAIAQDSEEPSAGTNWRWPMDGWVRRARPTRDRRALFLVRAYPQQNAICGPRPKTVAAGFNGSTRNHILTIAQTQQAE